MKDKNKEEVILSSLTRADELRPKMNWQYCIPEG